MQPTFSQIERFPWYAFVVYWAISALRVKQTKVTEEVGGRLLHVAVMVLACYLLFSERLGFGPLDSRFLPTETYIQDLGVALTYLGIALAIWARYSIGQYWSGRVTLKVDHQLIQSGLYGYMRHPIYTGLLLASAGTALVIGRWRCVTGLLIAIIELSRKAAKEEALLASEFGDSYQQYRQRTGFLLPRFH